MQDLVLAVTRIQELQTMFPQKSFYHTHHCTVVACACYKQGLQHGVVGFFVPQKQFNRMPAHTVMAAALVSHLENTVTNLAGIGGDRRWLA